MTSTEMQLREAVSSSKLGRYEIVALSFEWILLNKQNEDFRKLTETKLINKALTDVVTDVDILEKMEKLRKKKKKEIEHEPAIETNSKNK
ncbi:MAG: hypothetical protein LE180_01745 [Endomicrobium sp.]|uniref:hypothetical protein n=1 Tax=Candidatus Endomicrobiellum pyrsonymphae TaxID=1408203 RepID=UPI003573CA73|nr:hypothetical protein [Endomicrobium sp.]MCA6072115.1 hypothetical protein [Endomicrobium sp.]